ncbi:hypothetical protein A7U60_g8650 [Sanghuangporus baumii]|uniref:Uncharacterized protein n=1 Tax=Sanghuangporus baumii TaxID=108892 RepID=A0A9Q5HQB1_SANBA|nr:hypothetical protein A7U60_g8650 [Sanghuangporus baumii]
MSYRIFLSAPSSASLKNTAGQNFTWCTARSERSGFGTSQDAGKDAPLGACIDTEDSTMDGETRGWLLPPATLGAASQRISDIYKNVIFPQDDDDGLDLHEQDTRDGETGVRDETRDVSAEGSLISWPPTNADQMRSRNSLSHALIGTQSDSLEISEVSFAHTSTSSITAFPSFVINLHTLTTLSELVVRPVQPRWTCKVNLLVAILEVDGPDVVRIKKGPDSGKEVSVLRLVVGGEEGDVCKLTVWRETADTWGGVPEIQPDETIYENEGTKRGDIVYLENILASVSKSATTEVGFPNNEQKTVLTASPNLSSRLHICYRTLPTTPLDRRFRPDLRLATSDPGLRKVAIVVRWLERVMGLGS